MLGASVLLEIIEKLSSLINPYSASKLEICEKIEIWESVELPEKRFFKIYDTGSLDMNNTGNALKEEPEEFSGRDVVYFEDDESFSKLVSQFLGKNQYRVHVFHTFSEYEAYSGEINNPLVVLLDINLPEINGYEICRKLKSDNAYKDVPIIFSSGYDSDDEIVQAYEVGGSDYLSKPIIMEELLVKINNLNSLSKLSEDKDKQITDARTMVFEAMATSSELGKVLQLLERSMQASSVDELAVLLKESLEEFGVKASVLFRAGNEELYYNFSESENPLEKRILSQAKNKKKILDVGNKSLFNYPSLSLLVKNLPTDDPSKYGNIKDLMCIMLNGVEERVKGIMRQLENQTQKEHISIVANVIGQMVVDMEKNSVRLSEDLERVILDLQSNVESEFLRFNLLEEEERSLLEHVKNSIDAASLIFEKSLQMESQYGSIMQDLLTDLNKYSHSRLS